MESFHFPKLNLAHVLDTIAWKLLLVAITVFLNFEILSLFCQNPQRECIWCQSRAAIVYQLSHSPTTKLTAHTKSLPHIYFTSVCGMGEGWALTTLHSHHKWTHNHHDLFFFIAWRKLAVSVEGPDPALHAAVNKMWHRQSQPGLAVCSVCTVSLLLTKELHKLLPQYLISYLKQFHHSVMC